MTPATLPKTFDVHGQSYLSRFYRNDDGSVWFERFQENTEARIQTDVFGMYWSIAILSRACTVAIARHGTQVSITGEAVFYIPPFSVIEWHLRPGPLAFKVFFFRKPLSSFLSRESFAFAWNQKYSTLSLNTETLNTLIASAGASEQTPIGKEEVPSAVAEKTKRAIDATFNRNVSLAQIGQQLGYSHAIMTRAFKRCYGLPPLQYRNKMRVFEATVIMAMRGQNVVSTAAEVGFNDLSRFNKNFRRQVRALPSQFRAPWKACP